MRSRSTTRCLLLLGVAAALPAQERAGKWRPVPGLAAAEPLPVSLPRARKHDVGTGVVFTARGTERSVWWMQDGKLAEAPLPARATGGALRELDFGSEAPGSMQIGDFDGDGRVEVIVRWVLPVVAHVHLDEPDRVIKDSKPMDGTDRDGPWFSGSAFDWFGDGHANLLLVDGSRVVARRDPLTRRDTVVLVDLGAANVPAGTTFAGTAGDFDLDGLPDLVIALPDRGLLWCRHEGTRIAPRFSAPTPLWPADPGVLVTSVLLFPIDDDPWPDVVVGSAERAVDGHGDFRVREPRVRTEVEEETLRAIEKEAAGDTLPRLPNSPVRVGSDVDPFTKLLAHKKRQDSIDALRWRQVPMTARAPVVHYRGKPR